MWLSPSPIVLIWKVSALITTDFSIYNPENLDVPITEKVGRDVIQLVEHEEQCSFEFLELVYVDEQEITEVNQEYLEKDYITDIITFRYDEDETRGAIEGTIFCCAPRISEQAKEFNETEESEFLRIFIHGLLHLNGYEDDTPEKKEKMRERENYYLAKLL